MSGIQYAGEYSLKEMKILTSAGAVFDIKNMVQEIEIFEDLNSPSLTGNITILDIDNVMENAPIIGQEYMSLKIATPTLEEEQIDFGKNVFAIYKILNRESGSDRSQIFTLSFCSPELLRSNRTKISKSYTETIDMIVENVLRDSRYINTNKKLFLEKTSGVRKVVSPNLRPFAFIHNLKEEALSVKHNSPHFFFYENTKGIHFKSLQSMYAGGVIGEYNTGNVEIFGHDERSPNVKSAFEKVIHFQVNSNNDMLLNIRGGMLGSKMTQFNIYNKTYNTQTFSYFDDFDKFPRLNENPIYNNSMIDEDKNTIGSFTDSKIHLHAISSGDNIDRQHDTTEGNYTYTPNRISDSIPQRQSKEIELNNGVNISMRIAGNTTIAVGQLINLTIPVVGRVHEKNTDEYLSGKYLITKLRHIFSQAEKKHEIVLNACKDSLPKEYPINSDSREPKGDKDESIEVNYTL